MQKIGFNQHYGLHDAVVVTETKTKTRRLEKCLDKLYEAEERLGEPLVISEQQVVNEYLELTKTNAHILYLKPRYKLGEVVAVAQAYKDVLNELPDRYREMVIGLYSDSKAWTNKLYVRPDLMPHQIEITGIRVERLQDISHEDCLKEGMLRKPHPFVREAGWVYQFPNDSYNYTDCYYCFADLIDKVSGKGTWERNPWVLVYSFKKIK